jgi:hypothetical protein
MINDFSFKILLFVMFVIFVQSQTLRTYIM